MDKVFVLIISMWGNNGTEWEYIGNQMVLNQDMTKAQCEYMASDAQWTRFNNNEYYNMQLDCFPKDCQGKEKCEQQSVLPLDKTAKQQYTYIK